MSEIKTFIKLFDERIAKVLHDGGFSYTTEKINGNQTLFVFERSDELDYAINSLINENHYSEIIIIEDPKLNF